MNFQTILTLGGKYCNGKVRNRTLHHERKLTALPLSYLPPIRYHQRHHYDSSLLGGELSQMSLVGFEPTTKDT